MKYLLDTNTISYFLKGEPSVCRTLLQKISSDLCISSVSIAEIYFGIHSATSKKILLLQKVFEELINSKDLHVISFDTHAARIFALVKAKYKKKGITVSDLDLQIASIAMTHDLVLVTNDHIFSKINELVVENWM